jgi:hypothetical protein
VPPHAAFVLEIRATVVRSCDVDLLNPINADDSLHQDASLTRVQSFG